MRKIFKTRGGPATKIFILKKKGELDEEGIRDQKRRPKGYT